MSPDSSIINASIPNSSKDFTKKKRANRSAKLKQCKLDARREQWLSQVKNKSPKEVGGGNGESDGPVIGKRKAKVKGKGHCRKGVKSTPRSVNVEVIDNHESDLEELLMVNSPIGSVTGLGNGYGGSSTSRSSSASSLSFGSGGCCSGSITEEEEGGEGEESGADDECLDDWETVADALVGAEINDKKGHDEEVRSDSDPASLIHGSSDHNVDAQTENGKPDQVEATNKAWRPDDTCRPQSLPNLSKNRSFPASSERLSFHSSNPWNRKMSPPVPTSCPICCEDLDLTDSVFLPCPCGFHLCLFCHKRILEEDARCPGCRKPYSSEAADKETSLSGGSLTTRLARSCSMFSRV